MSSAALFRLSGLALVVAFPILIVGWLLHPTGERLVDLLSPFQQAAHVAQFVAWVFVLLGLPGLYARQAQRAGWLGLVSFALTIVVAAYHCYLLLYEAYPAVLLARNPATRDLVVVGGPVAHGAGALEPLATILLIAPPLFGIATLRAGVFPPWSAWLQIVSVPLALVGMVILLLLWPADGLFRLPGPAQPIAALYYLLFAGYAGGGYALWTETAPRPARDARVSVARPAA